jgi:fructosamine-3-kinase
VTAVSGGCINHGARLDMEGGGAFFLKWNPAAPPGMFEAESDGLTALRSAKALRTPMPVARGGGAGVPGWFLMEHVAQGRPAPDFHARLGRGLASLHCPRGDEGDEKVGWHRGNWIGSLPQSNTPSASWAAFWRDERIVPQLERAREGGHLQGADGTLLDDLVDAIPRALADVDRIRPALLHGDLWNGNVYAGPGGEPVIIDPAVYRGHGEVDLAMTELFGGFSSDFYDAYEEAAAIDPAYRAVRRDLYQLYYLLVHVNLFGSGYVAGTVAATKRVLAAV